MLLSKKPWINYVWQSGLATLAMFLVSLVLTMEHAVIVSSIASTAFIVFALPKSITATPRRVIGGHIVGLLCGGFALFISNLFYLSPLFMYSFSVGLAIFVMVVTNTEHPPAAGTALGVALSGFSLKILVSVVSSVIILVIIHRILQPYLRDLI